MEAVLDIIIVCIIILCVYMGYKKGLVRTVMSFLSFIIAYIAANIFSPPLSEFLYSNWIKPAFVSGVTSKIDDIITPDIDLNKLVADKQPEFAGMVEDYGVELSEVDKWVSEGATSGNVAENLVEPVAQGVANFIAFAAVFVASLILLKILVSLMDSVAKLPVLNLLNKIGGTAVGVVYGLGLSYIFVLLVYNVLPYVASNTPLASARDEVVGGTVFFKLFCENLPVNFI